MAQDENPPAIERDAAEQELVSHAALVHKSWHVMIMDEAFWRRRLSGKLPQELISYFNHWHGAWIHQLSRFFNGNLIANPGFSPQKISVSKGLGKGTQANNCWRVQVACSDTEPCTDPALVKLGLPHGCGPDMRMLVLNTPTWANPEAAQEVNLLRRLVEQGMSISMAAAYLDSCPSIEFSVWCYCGHDQPSSWHRGYAVCVLDNGRDSGVEWRSLKKGSQLSTNNASAYWISWAPDNTLLRGCVMLPREVIHTDSGDYKRLACVFRGYQKGIRRVHILLKGLDPSNVYAIGAKDSKTKDCKPHTRFISPSLKFLMPDA